ncbi:hypothetical protein [Parendozoicomonas haliclonae]|uniref:Cation/multidrug efflux pump n=1 Tax=Parendozoicomonas haliclonae TaxID=1960125 RepID=A0A1X7ALV5_9GAMM|nr:hypothetical protein [Parendozoicomonas haliclonae]SMA49129.1 hypothetical protein EHSB41UT_03071 [Parendozoicomonas haliclonae]
MQTFLLILLPLLVTLLLVWLTGRLLLNKDWLLGWLRGTVGLLFLVLSVFAILLTWDMRTFSKGVAERPLAVVSFSEESPQMWNADVSLEGELNSFAIEGDLWSLDVSYLNASMGQYKLNLLRPEALTGRYLTLEQNRQGLALDYRLHQPFQKLDSWLLLEKVDPLRYVTAETLNLPFIPMADGAIFEVYLRSDALEVEAVNKPAKEAMESAG